MRPSELVLVEWQSKGALILDGKAQTRNRGDQDVVEYRHIAGSLQSGKVRLLGRPHEVMQLGNEDGREDGERDPD